MYERVCNYSELFMRANGDVYPCCRLWARNEYRIGHITDPDIAVKVLAFYKPCVCEAFVFRRPTADDKPAFSRFNIETSLFCQANCAMCCVGSPDYTGTPDSPYLQELGALIEKLNPAALTVQGGEVLVQKQTLEWLKQLKQSCPALKLTAVTNLCVPVSCVDELESLFAELHVSMVGFQPETYSAIMGLDVGRTQPMIQALIRRNKVKVMLKYLLLPLNVHEVGAWLEWALASGARSLQIAYASGWEWVVPQTQYQFWEKIYERASVRLKRVLVSHFRHETGVKLVFEENAANLLDVSSAFIEKQELKGISGVGGGLPLNATNTISSVRQTSGGTMTKQVRHEFEEMWSFVSSRSSGAYIYGAGMIGQLLVEFIQSRSLPWPAAIVDDQPGTPELKGIPVVRLDTISLGPQDAVVLGTDAFQEAMRANLRARSFKGSVLDASIFIEKQRVMPTTIFKSCRMCSGIFLKSDGLLTCGCNSGYNKVLADAATVHGGDFFMGPVIDRIRRSFKEGRYPWDICATCISRLSETVPDINTVALILHVEPTNHCNLFCDHCMSAMERLMKPPKQRHVLPLAVFEKFIRELAERHVKVGTVAFCGYGEPVMNPALPQMVRVAQATYPGTYLYLDTNACLPSHFASPLADCGLSLINFGVDGSDQASYATFRKNGDYAQCVAFMKEVADRRKQSGSPTILRWKYILFNHNDSDDCLRRAVDTARSIGVDMVFHQTCSSNRSLRPLDDLRPIIGDAKAEFYLDDAFREK